MLDSFGSVHYPVRAHESHFAVDLNADLDALVDSVVDFADDVETDQKVLKTTFLLAYHLEIPLVHSLVCHLLLFPVSWLEQA